MRFLESFEIFQNQWSFCSIFGIGFVKMMFKTSCIASHLYYNNIFKYYRCVLYLLQCCVLVGLDWAEPMLQLYLHVTCSCIPMHTYHLFYIFWYICCLVLFWLSPSFSLFLSLYVSCVMAPKHKSTPSWKPLRSGASSSFAPFDPTPSSV